MKKLLLVLMVVALAAFLFVGCLPTTPPIDDDDDGDGVVTEVTVDIADSVVVDGKTYVDAGAHDITVTFPSAVAGNVKAKITPCTGDYKAPTEVDVILFPDADRKVWTGSGEFAYDPADPTTVGDCCASYVEVTSGECLDEVCITLPVIVDGGDPFARVKVSIDGCYCGDCMLTFESITEESICDPDEECCGDDCSGLASWSLKFYDNDPFDICCDATCEEPYDTCSGTACPIECTTECLEEGATYYVIATLADEVGNKVTRYGKFEFDSTCEVTYNWDIDTSTTPPCVTWGADETVDSDETVEFDIGGGCE